MLHSGIYKQLQVDRLDLELILFVLALFSERVSSLFIVRYIHCVREKKRRYIGLNFDKFKYIVVISCKECHEGNAKLLTQQKSASPNQCRYFTLCIRQSPCIAKHKIITDNCS